MRRRELHPAPKDGDPSTRRGGRDPRRILKIGAWNVRTMAANIKVSKNRGVQVLGHGLGKEEMLCMELKRKNLELCAISEHRWKGFGELPHGEHLILYSGVPRESQKAEQGVGFVLGGRVRRAWKDSGSTVRYVNSRIMSIRFKIRGRNYTAVAVYAPTFNSTAETKDEFYRELQKEISKAPAGDVLITLGDWNARVGVRDDVWREVLGPHGFAERNDNGDRVLELCTANRLRVMNTFFQHRVYGTWLHPRYKTWHVLDLVLVRTKSARQVLDCRVVCDAECDTDHRLVVTKLKLSRPERFRTGSSGHCRPQRLDVLKLRNAEVAERFRERVHDKLETLHTQTGRKGEYRRPQGGIAPNIDHLPQIDEYINIYTDGSCSENRLVSADTPAGWGVSVSLRGRILEERVTQGPDMFGPVTTRPTDRFYVGATVGSNNTGELQAVIEALLWVRDFAPALGTVVVHIDSQLAIDAAIGNGSLKSSPGMADTLADLFLDVQRTRTVWLLKVKGHSNIPGNERADMLAKRGAEGRTCAVGRYGPSQSARPVSFKASDPLLQSASKRLRAKTATAPHGFQCESWTAAVREAGEEVLGHKPNRTRPQWQTDNSQRIQQISDEKREAFQSGDRERYRQACKTARRKMRAILNEWWNDQAKQIQEAEDRHDTKGVFDGVRGLHGAITRGSRATALKAEDGTSWLDTSEQRRHRWHQHHATQLNIPTAADAESINAVPQRQTASRLDAPISRGEVRRALKQMRGGKAPGIDGIESELLRALDCEQKEELFLIVQDAWLNRVPQIWKDAFIINLPKKDSDLTLCDSWRGISLLSIAGKVFTKVLNFRIAEYVESEGILPESQCGGRAGRATSDALHCLRLTCEYRREKGFKTFLTFYDLTKAYDRVPREGLWKVLGKEGIPPRMMRVLQELHNGMEAKVDVEGGLTEPIKVVNGVRQGCCLAFVI